MLPQLKMKLVISLVAVLLAIVLLASVTFAWFSASTSPEMSSVSFNITLYHTLQVSLSQDGPWSESVSLAASFTDADLVKVLQPVSTLDGVNWFSCTYDDGTLKALSEFDHSDTLAWGNVSYLASFTDASGTDITNPDDVKDAAEAQSHFVYTDFWLRSEDPNGCKVRLSVPSKTSDTELNNLYGTYVLGKYVVSGTDSIVCDSNGAETAVRIGFQIYGDGPDASPTDFFIYEPNADKRSSAVDKQMAGDYVVGYGFTSDTYTNEYYLKTSPVGWLPDFETYPVPTLYVVSGDGMTEFTGTMISTDTDYYVSGTDYVSATDTPQYWSGNGSEWNYVLFEPPELYADNRPVLKHDVVTLTDLNSTYYYVTGYSAKLSEIDPEHLIVQKGCEWDLDKVKEQLQESNGTKTPDSSAVASFGQFLDPTEIYADSAVATQVSTLSADIASNAVLLELKDDTPVKVRLFVWVEGQDPDCWNDIHTGSFTINIELAGESLK